MRHYIFRVQGFFGTFIFIEFLPIGALEKISFVMSSLLIDTITTSPLSSEMDKYPYKEGTFSLIFITIFMKIFSSQENWFFEFYHP